MNTRSQTMEKHTISLEEMNAIFEESSRAWRLNKKSLGNGQYKYICLLEPNGVKCNKICYKDLSYCWQHRKQIN